MVDNKRSPKTIFDSEDLETSLKDWLDWACHRIHR